MTLIPELKEDLIRGLTAERPRVGRRWRQRRAGLLAAGAVAVSSTAFAASGVWRPVLGDQHRGHPGVASVSVPADQRAALGVLRRPQTAADRGPQVQDILRLLVRREIGGVHLDGIRLLGRHPGGVTILIPTERVGARELGDSSTVRRDVLCLLNSFTSARRKPGLPARALDGASQVCGTLQELRARGIKMVAPSGLATTGLSAGLVPDGVVAVILRFSDGRTRTVPVHDNYFQVVGRTMPLTFKTSWLNARGQIVPPRTNISP